MPAVRQIAKPATRRHVNNRSTVHLEAGKSWQPKLLLHCAMFSCTNIPVAQYARHTCLHVGHIMRSDGLCLACGGSADDKACPGRVGVPKVTDVDLLLKSRSGLDDFRRRNTIDDLAVSMSRLRPKRRLRSNRATLCAEVHCLVASRAALKNTPTRLVLLMHTAQKGLHLVSAYDMEIGAAIPFQGTAIPASEVAQRSEQLGGGSYVAEDGDVCFFPTGIGAFVNHACGRAANMSLVDSYGEEERGCVERGFKLVATKRIKAGDELVWDYVKELDGAERAARLKKFFQGPCRCSTCVKK